MSAQITPSSTSLAARWWTFIGERFPLAVHVPTVFFFVLGNAAVVAQLQQQSLDLLRLSASMLLTLSFFFRLRCFDEIKDYDTDCRVNPGRPLARGLLQIPQVKHVIYALTAFELLLAAALGGHVLATHAIAVGYSYLMYREFFIGRWLSQHLTTYAVTHTFVSILIGYSIAAQTSGLWLGAFPAALVVFSCVNWMLFNLFEFARKTYAPSEERPGVETYSSLFRPVGAAALSLSQIAVALFLLARLPAEVLASGWLPVPGWWVQLAAALALPTLTACIYVARASAPSAALFRNLTSVYLLVFYALLACQALT